MAEWLFYIIRNGNRTYAGVSPDPVRRLRQHNKELAGGAKYTTAHAPGWEHICIIQGFANSQQALQFEWAVKHQAPRRVGGLSSRLRKLHKTLCSTQWTRNACPAADVPLHVKLIGCAFEARSTLPDYVSLEEV